MRAMKLALRSVWLGLAVASSVQAGGVYTATNDAAGNAVMAYHRAKNGDLSPIQVYPTGGLGTSAGLGNQGGLAIAQNARWLYVVNAGSHDITAFAIGGSQGGLRSIQRIASGGNKPISLTVFGDLLYVLNADSDSVSGFRIGDNGKLSPLPGPAHTLSGTGVGAAQVHFSTDGRTLVVTEKATNHIVSFDVDGLGGLGPAMITDSPAPTPFGFAFGRRNQLFVTQANGGSAGASSLAVFTAQPGGKLSPVGNPVATRQTAACWVAVTVDGRFAYTANTPNDTVSGFRLSENGKPDLLDPSGVAASFAAGSKPVDLVLSDDNQYLYSLNSGAGSIGLFHIETDGALVPMSGGASGLPATINGLAAF